MRHFRFLVLLCSLVAGALASPVLLQKDCTKGPEVWCQNLQTASHCKAVKHCRQTVWNKPTVKSIPCDLCKEVVTVAGKFLKDNATEEEIYAYMTKACEFLQDQGLVAECKQMVDAYLPDILDMIKEELDNPEVVCSALTLCQSLQKHLAEIKLQKQLQSNKIPELDFSEVASPFIANVPLLLYPQDKPQQKSQDGGNVCTDCIQLVTDIQEAVRNNATFVSSLIDHAIKQCELLGPVFADMCKSYISQYSDLAIQMMMHMEQQPADICNLIGFCSSLKSVPLQTLVPAKVISQVKEESIENSLSQVESFSLCDACTIMVEEVASLLESNKSEEEIVHEMEKICSVLPEKFREECRDFVEVYGKSIIDMLLEATNPKLVCVLLKCCTDNALPAEKIVPAKTEVGDFCDVCKMIVAYADKELAKNATTAEIEAFMEKVCRFLPESVSDQCVQFVEKYEPVVIELLAEMMDPAFVCTKLGVCVASTPPLLGTEVCVQGPGYWCKNMETASRCNAVEHCKHHVWN
ncbi:prosaposin isoform X2 [Varanus komodoensis]|uniref:prosaposin isoform X2 n=1 Tax=Varanus komodoensis TaxID=61221 RepID=UPI001CF7CD3A|nr:prosaposin isoform X2 [Varanus komodoensis]